MNAYSEEFVLVDLFLVWNRGFSSFMHQRNWMGNGHKGLKKMKTYEASNGFVRIDTTSLCTTSPFRKFKEWEALCSFVSSADDALEQFKKVNQPKQNEGMCFEWKEQKHMDRTQCYDCLRSDHSSPSLFSVLNREKPEIQYIRFELPGYGDT